MEVTKVTKQDKRAYAEMIVSLTITTATIENNLALGLNLEPEHWQKLLTAVRKLKKIEKTIINQAGRLELEQPNF